jgi:hypothetical protein
MAGRKALFFPLLFFFLPSLLAGQEGEYSAGAKTSPPETGEGSFYIERTGEEERFIQRLAWEAADHVYRYEVRIEGQDSSGEYAEILREFRAENFIDLSLAPGLYRYRIQVYNLLNRPAGDSEWIYFRVFPALRPELYSVTQEFASSREGELVEIIIYGMNLVEGAEAYLVSPEKGRLAPRAYLPAGESARLVFDPPLPGRYQLRIRNPGGLEGSLEITIEPPPVSIAADTPGPALSGAPVSGEPVPAADTAPGSASGGDTVPDNGAAGNFRAARGFDLSVSAEYAPLIPLYGYLFDRLDQALYPRGFSLRLALIPVRQPWGDLGLEAAPYWSMLAGDNSATVHLGALHLNGIYQRRLPNPMMSLVFRLGAGIHLLYGVSGGGQNSGSIFTWISSVNGGLSFRWYMRTVKNFRWVSYSSFYFELGAEYVHVFSKDPPPGYIKPALGAGWKF